MMTDEQVIHYFTSRGYSYDAERQQFTMKRKPPFTLKEARVMIASGAPPFLC